MTLKERIKKAIEENMIKPSGDGVAKPSQYLDKTVEEIVGLFDKGFMIDLANGKADEVLGWMDKYKSI